MTSRSSRSAVGAEYLKQAIPFPAMLDKYGFETNQRGFMCCPFHSEKTGSFKAYENSWHCYGCQANGDIFTFVQKLFNLTFPQAIIRIRNDFGFGYATQDNKELERIRRKQYEKKRKQAEKERQFYNWISERQFLIAEIGLTEDGQRKSLLMARLEQVKHLINQDLGGA